jgi:hypothetical protein
MAKKRTKPEQVVTLLRQIEEAVANAKTTPQKRRDAESWSILPQTMGPSSSPRNCGRG